MDHDDDSETTTATAAADTTLTESETWPMADLSSLAQMYQHQRPSEPMLTSHHETTSSIDQLLDSFFTTASTTPPSSSSASSKPIQTNLTPTYQRIKSISMSENMNSNKRNDDQDDQTPSEVCFSLNDLAAEYLAANPVSADHSRESSLVDLSSALAQVAKSPPTSSSINTTKTTKTSSFIESTKKKATENEPATKLEFIRSQPVEVSLVSSLFEVTKSDIESGGRTIRTKSGSIENLNLAACFDYEHQVARERLRCSTRKRIVVEDGSGGGGGSGSKSGSTATKSGKVGKSKSSGGGSGGGKSKSSSAVVKIEIFDFSIPSPDDIVKAKQKLAFRNTSRVK